MQTTTETVRRWVQAGELTLDESANGTRIDWESLRARARTQGDPPPAHWGWIQADLQQPPPAEAADSSFTDARTLHQRLVWAEAERDIALAEAENLDQAVMAYRDNWRRRTQPQGAPSEPESVENR